MKDMPNLDLLRSMAVLMVVIAHMMEQKGIGAIHGFNYGYCADLGVVIFFVHTCLVLMWSLERNPDTLGFYVRRAFRIYPLAIVAILLVVTFRIPVGIDPTHNYAGLVSRWQLPANLLLVQNLAMLPNVMGPLWTLPLELQMYLLLPFLFAFVRSNTIFWPMVVLWFATFSLDYFHTAYGANYIVMVMPYFLPGVIAYVGFKRIKPILPGWLMPLCVMLMVFLVTFRGRYRVTCVFALLLGLLLPLFRQVQWRPINVASFTIARYSYGLYLSHPFAIAVAYVVLRGHSSSFEVATMVIFLLITVVPAYHFIEAPMIALGSRVAKRIARSHGITVHGDQLKTI